MPWALKKGRRRRRTYDFTGQRSNKNLSYLLEKPPDLQYKNVSVNFSMDVLYYILD
jgi:hypothetical protein